MRYRFEKPSQIFDLKKDDVAILPLSCWQKGCWAEIPALIYANDEELVFGKLKSLKAEGLTDVVCENLSAVQMAKELGLRMHGGMFLNILNSESLSQYKSLGLYDACISMELSFAEAKKLKADLPFGFVIYGYLPLMKYRSCPGDCKACRGQSIITDRLGEKFTLICRDKKYSELLNSVPLYVGDRQIPSCSFTECYFTIESREQAAKIAELIRNREEFPGRKTAGLYFRELL